MFFDVYQTANSNQSTNNIKHVTLFIHICINIQSIIIIKTKTLIT